MAATECPSIEHWQKLVDEALNEVEEAELQEHLEHCSRCHDVLAEVASLGESAADLMAHLRGQRELHREAALNRAMNEIRAQTLFAETPGGPFSAADMTLDFLAAADSADHLGRLGAYQITEVIGCG